jgi:transposase
MDELKLKQLQYESDTWKRLLAFMMDENVHLKNWLSEILKQRLDPTTTEEMENFQNHFVKEDQLIGLLRHELVELDKLLVREIFEDGQLMKSVQKKLRQVRKNMIVSEREFRKLKSAFHSYLAENI